VSERRSRDVAYRRLSCCANFPVYYAPAVFAEGPRDTMAAGGNIRQPMFVINRLTGSTLLVLVSANFSILAWERMPLRADFAV